MLDLTEVTTLLKTTGVNSVAKKLKVKKSEIYNLLHENCLKYENGYVIPIDSNVNEIAITKVIQSDKKNLNGSLRNAKQKEIDLSKLQELIHLLEPIKEVIQEYNKSKNFVEVKPIELRVKNITEVKQKLFKVDVDVLKKWEEFVSENKQYKVQNLISLALEEFIEKYQK